MKTKNGMCYTAAGSEPFEKKKMINLLKPITSIAVVLFEDRAKTRTKLVRFVYVNGDYGGRATVSTIIRVVLHASNDR